MHTSVQLMVPSFYSTGFANCNFHNFVQCTVLYECFERLWRMHHNHHPTAAIQEEVMLAVQ